MFAHRVSASAARFSFALGLAVCASGAAAAQVADSTAAQILREYRAASRGIAERLWARPLGGPLVLVDRGTRRAFSAVPLPEDGFTPVDSMYVGRWPDTLTLANTAIRHGGRDLSIVGLPIDDDRYLRIALLMHESFHRLQPALGLGARDALSPHLEDCDGRLWLRLELRALSYAITSSGDDRTRHARNAMHFRQRRHLLYAEAFALESQLELQEGLPEYTGQRVALAVTGLGPLRVVRTIDAHMNDPSYARSFAYATGPALGLLLDACVPGWRGRIAARRDMAGMLMEALGMKAPVLSEAAVIELARPYGYDALLATETRRAQQRQARIAEYRGRFVDGSVLTLQQDALGTSYDPLTLFPFDTLGTVYPTGRFSAEWGVLQVDSLGALVSADMRRVRVAAPAAARSEPRTETMNAPLSGPGWVLRLSDGWAIEPAQRRGDWVVRRRSR